MASHLEPHLAVIRDTQEKLLGLLEGMDYCLDWKPEASAWSARQVIYHLLDTPPGGLAAVVGGIISGEVSEYDLWSDLDNVTPDRQGHDLERVISEINGFFSSLNETLAAAGSQELISKTAVVHNKSRGTDDRRTAGEILERGFGNHWAGHLDQLRELRESLGF